MLRYKYEQSIETKLPSCKECKKYTGGCPYQSRVNNNLGACMYGEFQYREPEINTGNAQWYINQMMYDIQLSASGAESIKRNHMMNDVRPEALKDNDLIQGPTFTEAYIFKKIMNEFLHMILERKKEYDKIKRDISSTKAAFVNSIINTRIRIDDNLIRIYTYNDELVQRIKKVAKEEKCKMLVLNNLNDMEFYSCQVPTMKESSKKTLLVVAG